MKRKKRLGSSSNNLEPTANNDQETTTNSKGKFGRRGFLKVGAGAAAAALVNPLESIAQPTTPTTLQSNTNGECNDVPFTEPTKIFACGSELKYELNAEKLNWAYVCPGNPPTTKSGIQPVFNGALPGPSLYVDRGATISLTLNNKLDSMPVFTNDNCVDGHHQDPTKPACFAHTNMHFHGLQVSPCSIDSSGQLHCGPFQIKGDDKLKFSSDDVLVDIFPGKSNEYRVVLPDMHAPGTNWYHSHMHGGSAYQVSGGMAGALIIREPENAQIVRQDLDKIFVLQEILVNPPPPAPWPPFPPIYGSQPGGGGTQVKTDFFVNGLCRPTLKMKQKQMMRWRFINTGVTPGALMKLKVIRPTTQTCSGTFPNPVPTGELMHLIAIDGLSFYGINPQPVRYHLMGLGSRADFLVKFDEPGIYTLLKDSYPLASVLQPDSPTSTFATSDTQKVLMYIEVEPSTQYKDEIPRVIPGNKPAYLQAIWNVDRVRADPVRFQNPGAAKFQIDGAPYDLNKDIEVQLNTAEEWTLLNEATPPSGGNAPPQSNTHPFHVHLNPFQILGVPFDFEVTDADLQRFNFKRMDPNNPCNWPFWDTVPLPGAAKSGTTPPPTTTLKIRSRFLIYGGEYVTHCHILVHEDVGMMIDVKLNVPAGEKPVLPGEPVHDYPPAAKACIDRTIRPCPSS